MSWRVAGKTAGSTVFILTLIGSLASWMRMLVADSDHPAWIWPISLSVLCLLSGGIVYGIGRLPDLVPDYLRHRTKDRFSHNGLCFAFDIHVVDRVAFLEVYYQNPYEGPCLAQIALRTMEPFWKIWSTEQGVVVYDIDCPAAGFGVARWAIGIPPQRQGKDQRFEVGACVEYPKGKGKRLRFQNGQVVQTNTQFQMVFGLTAILFFLRGEGDWLSVMTSPQVQVTLKWPTGVLDELPVESPLEIETWWKLGDPPLESADAQAKPQATRIATTG